MPAATAVARVAAMFAALRRPHAGALAAFRGEQAQGVWTLRVCDTFSGADDGQYLRSELFFQAAGAPGASTTAWTARLSLPQHVVAARSWAIYGLDAVGRRSAALLVDTRADTAAPVVALTTTIPPTGTILLAPGAFGGTVADDHSVRMELLVRTADGRLARDHIIPVGGSWAYDAPDPAVFPADEPVCTWVHARDQANNLTVLGPFALTATWNVPVFTQVRIYLPLIQRSPDLAPARSAQGFRAGGPSASAPRFSVGATDSCQ